MEQGNGNHGIQQSSPSHQIATVHGQSSNGCIRVKHQGQNHLVTGRLKERHCSKNAHGMVKIFYRLVSTTPGYQSSPLTDWIVDAVCPTTGKNFRVSGKFKTLAPKSVSVLHKAAEATPAITVNTVAKSPVVRSEPNPAFAREYFIIAAQRAAGLDPDLRMSFITVFLNESKANLYRKMGKAFPQPIKRGKSSFWPMSQIEAYKAGQLVGVSV
nr:hypothetical protein [Rhodoferax sp.]